MNQELKSLEVEKMAIRALLHMNKLKDFESWLEKQGYMILPASKNPYEILRAKKDKDTVIIHQKGDSKEHLSIMDKDYALIHTQAGRSAGIPTHRIGTATNRDSPLLPHHSIDLTQHDIRHSHVQLDSIHHH